MSRLSWQPIRGIAATGWPGSRKDRSPQSSARARASFHPLKKIRQACDRVLRLQSDGHDGDAKGRSGKERECGQPESPQPVADDALGRVEFAMIARLFQRILVWLICDVNPSLASPATSFILNIHLSAVVVSYWLLFNDVIGKSPIQRGAVESVSPKAQPKSSRRQLASGWLGGSSARSPLSLSSLQGLLTAHDDGATGRKRAGRTATSGRGKAGKIGKTFVGRLKRQADRLGAPRLRRAPPSGNESDSPSEHEALASKARSTNRKSKGKRFACPYLKRDPLHHLKCLCQHQEGSRRVRQHLSRSHRQPIHCPTCNEIFKLRVACDQHITARGCVAGTNSPPEGITPDQQTQLDRITANSEEERWFAIWRVLFPDIEPPGSPYVDPDNLGGFLAEEVHRAYRPLYREHLQSSLDDRQLEEFFTYLDLNSRSYLSPSSGSLAGRCPSLPGNEQPSFSNVSLEDWNTISREEPPDTATTGFSQAMSPGAFVRQAPHDSTGSSLDERPGIDPPPHNAAPNPDGRIGIPRQTLGNPETIVGETTPAEDMTLLFMWNLSAEDFPLNDNNQYMDRPASTYGYPPTNPLLLGGFGGGFGVGSTNSQPNGGHSPAHQMYGPGVVQNDPLADSYGSRNPQRLRYTTNPYYPGRPQEAVAGPSRIYTHHSTLSGGPLGSSTDHNGGGDYTHHIDFPGTTGIHNTRYASAGHAPALADAEDPGPERRRRRFQ